MRTRAWVLLLLLAPSIVSSQTASDSTAPSVRKAPVPDLVLTPAELQAIGRAKAAPTETVPDLAPNARETTPDPSKMADWRETDGPVRISLLDTLVKLGVVVVLLLGSLQLYRGLTHRRRAADDFASPTLCLLQTMPMRGNKALHVVEAGPRTLLIADTGSRLAILADLTPHGPTGEAVTAVQPGRPNAVEAKGARPDHFDWEDDTRGPAPVPTDSGTRRLAARRVQPERDAISPTAVRSRRALLLRALRSKEEARREPAFAHHDEF